MLDTTAFLKRLKLILTHHELSSAAFADLIHVQRSSISHLLNGRNKPSLEFIMKIHEAFPEADLQWLLYDKGTFPNVTSENKLNSFTKNKAAPLSKAPSQKAIERVVIFYTDGTYKNYIEQ
ncbi:helix-turn-helix domain-containing protein [Maribacter sp. ACAM166]|uniref:helix-turn-helix domain-containing protein n=1 Tax=Maribacter sp. ACAM166 TaxID=2508996 RepID=UPI0010FE32A9|nr:helix-turn-helix transcriptional regulator [Maribacter sp. ACAM166]TLP79652.1 helix-turn-helix transcriptional regulator [Maribacter sp. ACAM166]